MVVRKLSVSFSPELAESLRALARERDDDLSRLVETLLREHPLVVRRIQEIRMRARGLAEERGPAQRDAWAQGLRAPGA